MKTSNKILLGLVVALVLLPVLMLLGFNRKIANKDFVVKQYEWKLNSRKAYALKPARYVKLEAPDSTQLQCSIRYGTADQYRLEGYSFDDSLACTQIADTIFFRFIPSGKSGHFDENTELSFNLYMSSYDHIIANRANITIDSVGTRDSLQISLANNSSLQLGNQGEDDDPSVISYGAMKIVADNSRIQLHPKMTMQSLDLKLSGSSYLNIDKAAKLEKITGTISAGSEVKGPASYMYQLLFSND